MNKKIIDEFKKSGIPLELEIYEILEQDGWNTELGAYYLDDATKENREIDLIAQKTILFKCDEVRTAFIRIKLIIECKDTHKNKDWVFLTDKTTKISIYNLTDAQIRCNYPVFNGGKRHGWKGHYFLERMSKYHHYGDSSPVGLSSFVVGDSSKKQNYKGQIFKAITQVTKSTLYKMYGERQVVLASISKYGRQREIPFIEVVYPIIVFGGDIYSGLVNKGSIDNLQKTSHLKTTRKYIPLTFTKSKKPAEKNFVIDIMTRDYFYTHLAVIGGEMRKMRKDATEMMDDYFDDRKRIKRYIDNIREYLRF